MNPEKPSPVFVVPGTKRRDTIFVVAAAAVILGFVIYGIVEMGKPQKSANVLIGEVLEKMFTPQKEDQISFSGRRIEGVKHIEGEYVLKVRVERENRTYDVPVEKATYEGRSVGDKLEFVRPRSEQK